MIRLPAATIALSPAERYALDLLVDLARLPPVEDGGADVVRIEITDPPGEAPNLRGLIASRWMIEPADGVVRIPRSTLRTLTDVAGAVAEQRSSASDRHGRVPPDVNLLVAAGLEREPVVAQAAACLCEAVLAAAGRRAVRLVTPWPGAKRWAAALTHDLDVVSLWPVFTALRLAELAGKGEVGAALRAAASAAASIGGDPIWRAAADLLDRERTHAARSTWFILCGTPNLETMRAGDLTYLPESRAATRIVAEVARRGHAIGLHGSFATMDEGGVFGEQRARLARLAGHDITGVRQHFLRLRPGATHRAMEQAGFAYDASYGFPDRNGFRLGIADVLPFWDEGSARPLDLDEVPLCWMDRALSKYRGVEDPQAWVADALLLAEKCRAVGGLWVGVWHPNLVPALGYPGAPAAFVELLRGIVHRDPYLGTLDELVAWRRARRSVRVRALAPDGRADLAGAGAPGAGTAGAAVGLEDPRR